MPPLDFNAKVLEVEKIKLARYNEFVFNNPESSEKYNSILKIALTYPLYSKVENYPLAHSAKINDGKHQDINSSFYKHREFIATDKDSLMYFYAYRDYIVSNLYNKTYSLGHDLASDEFTIDLLNIISEQLNNENSINSMLRRIFITHFYRKSSSDINIETFNTYLKLSTSNEDEELVKNLILDCEKIKKGIVIQNFDITDYNKTKRSVKSLIKNKKSAYLALFQSDKAMFEIEIIGNRMLFNVKGKPTFIECINEIQKMNRQNTYEDYLFFKGRSDLTELVKIELQEAAPSSRAGKVKNFLSGFLPMQKTLLSTLALQKAASKELMIDVKTNELLNSILYNFPNCYQFDTRAWGLEENFKKLDSSEAQIFATAAIEYLRERPDKKIASKTIFHSITTTDLQIDSSILASLNHFDLNWALAKHMHQDPKLQNLGRLYWVYGQNHKSSSSTMKSLIEEFLTVSGKPMSTSHIREYILTKRSIAGNFQIRPSTSMGDIIPTAPGVWGLAFRDLAITRDQEQQLLRRLKNEFKQGNFVINEAKLSMIMQAIPLDKSLSLFQISRLLSRHASSNPSKKRDDFHVKTSVKHLNKCFVVSTESDVESSSLEF